MYQAGLVFVIPPIASPILRRGAISIPDLEARRFFNAEDLSILWIDHPLVGRLKQFAVCATVKQPFPS